MEKGSVQVICGPGFGKTTMALGKGVVAVTKHKKVIMIQFLKGSGGVRGTQVPGTGYEGVPV